MAFSPSANYAACAHLCINTIHREVLLQDDACPQRKFKEYSYIAARQLYVFIVKLNLAEVKL